MMDEGQPGRPVFYLGIIALSSQSFCICGSHHSTNMKRNSLLFVLLATTIFCSCSSTKKTSGSIEAISIVPRSGWNAAEPKPYKQHVPKRITVHHEGTKLEVSDDAAKKIMNIQRWGMGPDRKWADIPYHFLIAPNGKIYEGRNVFTVGETATEYEPTGHLLITCLGNLHEQEVEAAQLSSLIKLIAHCSSKYNLTIETLATHRDYSKQTTCPGKNLYQYFESGYLKEQVQKLLLK